MSGVYSHCSRCGARLLNQDLESDTKRHALFCRPVTAVPILEARVAELEAGIEAAMPCDYKRDGDDLDHSESCRKCALLNR